MTGSRGGSRNVVVRAIGTVYHEPGAVSAPAAPDFVPRFAARATDVVAARLEEGIARVRELTGGHGARAVLEAVGHLPAYVPGAGSIDATRVDTPRSRSRTAAPDTSSSPAARPPRTST